ncbi:acetyl-CoA carboxylase biotin carboxyl carrier protein subunit [Chryseolinea sp. H1M3-3]|uniref:acetyl-CoA carboxylase biotin carboxyl carrier protein subunit n=1 Tax=Chryseolinea sp. H1M3-3 TaxID=3034144 RepID=UPI0023EBC2DF|nr:acetyl-CoA carboxylase biotin carboxyl carrier protein subunit [Chryseolinea sp. H1M3-3]
MYKAIVNSKNLEIINRDQKLLISGSPLEWDILKISERYFHILINHKSYRAEVVSAQPATKSFVLKINGNVYSVELKDKFDLLLDKMGMANGLAGKANNVKAPMPGLIIDLRVKEGDIVMPGDALLILEAMKMENMIKASTQSIVKTVRVKKGDSVEKNQVLIEF